MKSRKNVTEFIKRNSYYLIIGICAAAIVTLSTFAIVKLASKAPITPPVITKPDDTGKDKDKDNDVEKPDDSEPVDGTILFVSPLNNLAIKTGFFDGLTGVHAVSTGFKTHLAIDFEGAEGDNVYSVLEGTVLSVINDGFGFEISIQHDNNLVTKYKNIASSKLVAGKTVNKGDIIGTLGKTIFESNTEIYLHFEVLDNGVEVNPLKYLNIEDK